MGIPPEVLPRIFERFWQVDTSSTRKFQGAGIGLALVRSLTEAMGGTVNVESQVNQGTTFTVELPAEDAETSAEPAAGEDPLKDGGHIAQLHRKAAMSIPGKIDARTVGPPEGVGRMPAPVIGRPSGARPLVLIADDEPDIRRFLRMQMENVDIIEASDGAEALEFAHLRRPAARLARPHDARDGRGRGLQRHPRQPRHRGMAIIILTARADEQTKLTALQAGANDFLTKPFSSAELALRLENQLAMARFRRELAEHQPRPPVRARTNQGERGVDGAQRETLRARPHERGHHPRDQQPAQLCQRRHPCAGSFSRDCPEHDRADFRDVLEDVRDGIERVSQIVIDLRKFTREDSMINDDADLVEIVDRARAADLPPVGRRHRFQPHHAGPTQWSAATQPTCPGLHQLLPEQHRRHRAATAPSTAASRAAST